MDVKAVGVHVANCKSLRYTQEGRVQTPFSPLPQIRFEKPADGPGGGWWIVFDCGYDGCNAQLWVRADEVLREVY